MTDPYALEPWLRSLIAIQLDKVSARIKAGPQTKMAWQSAKDDLLSMLNTIDRCVDYGNPGAGIDQLLGSKEEECTNADKTKKEMLDEYVEAQRTAQGQRTANMRFWDQLKTTDPAFTKKVEFGRKFTSINSQWQLQRMTETFGPVGQGWGYDVVHGVERLNDWYILAVADVTLWWQTSVGMAGIKCQFGPVRGSSPVIEPMRDKGRLVFEADGTTVRLHLDDDAGKKAMTDALTKGLSHIGLSADVFLGLYDDNKYVQSLKNKANGSAGIEGRMPPNETPSMAIDAVDEQDRGLVKDGETRSTYEVEKRAKAEKFTADTLGTWSLFRGGLELADWYNTPRSPKDKKTNRDWVENLKAVFPDLHQKLKVASDEISMRGSNVQ